MADKIVQAIERELEHWPGVEMTIEKPNGHRRAKFTFRDKSRFIILADTTGDHRTSRNSVRDMRKELQTLRAKRLDKPKRIKRIHTKAHKEVEQDMADAKISITDRDISIVVPPNSPILRSFVDENGHSVAHWQIEMGSNPDLSRDAQPYVVLRTAPKPDKRGGGIVKGSFIKASGSYLLRFSNAVAPALVSTFGMFNVVNMDIRDSSDDKLVFTLPAERPEYKPRADKKSTPSAIEQEQAIKALEPAPAEEPVIQPEPTPVPVQPIINGHDILQALAAAAGGKTPRLILQPPPRQIGIEEAIEIINKKKRELGRNLRLEIDHDTGLLRAHAKLGFH